VPYWLYPGEAAIERHVLVLPLSRELGRYDELKQAVVLYRLAFGQPRQQDLIEILLRAFPDAAIAQNAVEALRLDLGP